VRVAAGAADAVEAGLAKIREEHDVPGPFPADVLAEAEQAAAAMPGMVAGRPDRTGIPFVTLDPVSSTDLDQAFALERAGEDIVLHYAIADLSAFVEPGGAIEQEAWRRGVTVYLPDGKANLHPSVLAEDAASLLPDGRRPAVLLTVAVAPDGSPRLRAAEKVSVRSTAKLAYEDVDLARFPLLVELAARVRASEDRRGASRVDFPEQEVVGDPDRPGAYRLRLRPRLPSEDANSALSLSANLAVAAALLDARTGLFRVMDEPDERDVRALRLTARALSLRWPDDVDLATFQRSLDTKDPAAAAFLIAVRRAGRGASYEPYRDGVVPWHAAIAATYAHATAPLRRLADRCVLDAVVAVAAGDPVPDHVVRALPDLPEAMRRADTRASRVDRAVIDLLEAVALHGREGDEFEATVVSVEGRHAQVQLDDVAVVARVEHAGWDPGEAVRLRLVGADPVRRRVDFAPA
jgi:exoribonuclease R